MLIQLFAIAAYTLFAIVALAILKSYRLSVRNVFAFVFGGFLGFSAVGMSWLSFSNATGTITTGLFVAIYLGFLAIGLIGGSYFGLKYIGVKVSGT